MVKTYRIRLQLEGGFMTPWHADTIFGHLCWLIRYNDGAEVLQDFLQRYIDRKPYFVLSNGLPGDYLSRPCGLKNALAGNLTKSEKMTQNKLAKSIRKLEYISWAEFEHLLQGKLWDPSVGSAMRSKPLLTTYNLHNTIDRNTMTTGDVGELFELEEYYFNQEYQYLSIYVHIYDQAWVDKLKNLFEELSLVGFGKKKSIGKGSFKFIDMTPFEGFENFRDSDSGDRDYRHAAIMLSNFVPDSSDPIDGHYQLVVKYGKVGETSDRPFKKPLMMLKEGAVFFDDPPKAYYGTMIQDIAVGRPEVVQYGYGFAIPVKIYE